MRIYRRRFKQDADGNPVETPDGMGVEIETVALVLCACPCGYRWYAEAGSTTRCDRVCGCPLQSKPFEVPS